jgi:hypothetical protein
MVGGCTKLHDEELHNLYFSPDTIKIMKSRRMRWAGHVARMKEKRNAYRVLVGKLEGKKPPEDLNGGGKIILRWILEKSDEMVWTALIWLRKETSGGLL